MLAYTVVKSNDKRYILTLDIPEDAITTIGGDYVKIPETAQYRADKVKVVKIEDESENTFDNVMDNFTYTVGEITEDPEFDMDLSEFNCDGICFFLSREVADHYLAIHPETGAHKFFYTKRTAYEIRNFVNGKLHGSSTCYYSNGQLATDKLYENGYEIGTHTAFYKTGSIMASTPYTNGKKNGLYEAWHDNGVKHIAVCFVDDKMNGQCLKWLDNGKLIGNIVYDHGEIISSEMFAENE